MNLEEGIKELKAALQEYRQLGISEQIDYQNMLWEHAKNLRNETTEYKKSINEDFKVDQSGGPKATKVDQNSGPKTRDAILQLIANDGSITSREMANRLSINRSAISKHLKKMQEENIIRREGSARAGRWVVINNQ